MLSTLVSERITEFELVHLKFRSKTEASVETSQSESKLKLVFFRGQGGGGISKQA